LSELQVLQGLSNFLYNFFLFKYRELRLLWARVPLQIRGLSQPTQVSDLPVQKGIITEMFRVAERRTAENRITQGSPGASKLERLCINYRTKEIKCHLHRKIYLFMKVSIFDAGPVPLNKILCIHSTKFFR
jgi:hypothetical protein